MGAANVLNFGGTTTSAFSNAIAASDTTNANASNLRYVQADAGLEDAARVDSLSRGSLLAGRTRMAGSQLAAQQATAFANSGVDASVGTPASTIGGSLLMNELDAKTAENNAARDAFGHERMANEFRRKGAALQTTINNAGRDYTLKQTSTLLGGAGSAANMGGGE